MRILFAAITICIFITACSGDKPENLLNEDSYINLLVELQLLKSYQQQLPDTTDFDSLETAIYREYKITETQFVNSHDYYQKDIGKQNERIKEAIERLRKDRLQPRDTVAANDSTTIQKQQ